MTEKIERTAIRTCPLCESTCGLRLTLHGDTVVRTAGDELDVFSKGYMCPKGATLGEQYDDPDWLRKPVIREGNTFREVSWEEAFQKVDELMRPILDGAGPDVTSVYYGNPNGNGFSLLYLDKLQKSLGTRNLFSACTLDHRPKEISVKLMYGSNLAVPIPDIDRTDHLVVIGANPMVSNGSLATAGGWPRKLRTLRKRGGALVVIDPVRTRTADLASQHVQPLVGSDAALLASMVHVLFEEDLVDLGPLGEYVKNIDIVREAVRGFSPEDVSDYTGVDAGTIRQLARDLAHAPTACVYGRTGTTIQKFGSISSWLIEILNILTGNLDRVGGAMFPLPATGAENTTGRPRFGSRPRFGRYRTRVRSAPEILGEFPAVCLAEEIDTPGVGRYRALVLSAGNPVATAPNGQRLAAALEQLDAVIAIDPYITDTTKYAHVILPPPPVLQRPHYDVHYTKWAVRNYANFSPPVIPLGPDQLDEWEIILRLAAVFDGTYASTESMDEGMIRDMVEESVSDPYSAIHGRHVQDIMDQLEPRTGPERIVDFMLRVGPYGDGFGNTPGGLTLDQLEQNPHGLDFGPMTPRMPEVLRTEDGMIDLAPSMVVEDIPRLNADVLQGPSDGLKLVSRRALRSKNSWLHNVPSLMTGRERSALYISPEDAAERNLESGAFAEIRSDYGQIVVPVEVNPRMPPGVVSMPFGWLHDPDGVGQRIAASRPGTNSNRLASEFALDVPSWTPILSGGLSVQVERAATHSPNSPMAPPRVDRSAPAPVAVNGSSTST